MWDIALEGGRGEGGVRGWVGRKKSIIVRMMM